MNDGVCTCVCPPTATVNGVEIALIGPDSAHEWVKSAVESCGATHVVNHLAAHPTVEARKDPHFRALLNRADLNLADGMGPVWACRALGHTQPEERVYGPDFMLRVISDGLGSDVKHAFVGGTLDSLQTMIGNLKSQFPEVRFVGGVAPPFRDVSPQAVSEDLDGLAYADVLWVGLGTPKQQIWADLAREQRPAKIISTVGAAFNFHAGRTRQAPQWMQRNGLEWAFRLAVEPRRLFRRYVVGNAHFVAGVALDHVVLRSRSK